jgi:hypothetical protein
MALKNYTSTMSPSRTMGKIQRALAQNGARNVHIRYDDEGDPDAVAFQMDVGGSPVWFNLEPDIEGMLRALRDDPNVPKNKATREQARRTAWKNELEWLQVQLAKVAANQARIEQLLLGYAVTPDGDTVYERLQEQHQLLTGARAIPESTGGE